MKYVGVKHVIVCGHTQCGGLIASMKNDRVGLIDSWLTPVRALRCKHADELDSLDTMDAKTKRLAELNVQNSLEVLKTNPIIIDAMRDRGLQIHGVVYNLATGKLEPLETGESQEDFKKRIAAFETK